jgi:WD40 repeat protein
MKLGAPGRYNGKREHKMPVADNKFFVSGGTLPPHASSYIEREADSELLDALLDGTFAYVLNSRQMGKSSLAVRTMQTLATKGVLCGFVDLTRLGATGADPERWYAGLLVETGRAFQARELAIAYLKENAALSAPARYFGFLRQLVSERDQPIVLFIDEVDTTRSLPFPADDLFTGIRELWNARASEPALERLTICLLGAALPTDLVRDPRRTPFNVGKRIDLRDFTLEEARPLAAGMGPQGDQKLFAVMEWTGGHPFLTQSLCAELVANPDLSADALVAARYLEKRSRDTDTNLVDVANRLLGRGDPDVQDEDRAELLTTYAKMLRSREGIPDDETHRATARIKLSGVVRTVDGRLLIRNRIYKHAFDAAWVRENMPGQEIRRQRKAYWLGVIRTAAVASTILAVISVLALLAVGNARRATAAEAQARYDAYVSSMRTLFPIYERHDLSGIIRVLDRHKDFPGRGWEWDYWRAVVDEGNPVTLPTSYPLNLLASPDGNRLASIHLRTVYILDANTNTVLHTIPARSNHFFRRMVFWSPDSGKLITCEGEGILREWDAATGRELRSRLESGVGFASHRLASDGRTALASITGRGYIRFDIEDLRAFPDDRQIIPMDIQGLSISGNGKTFAYHEPPTAERPRTVTIRDLLTLEKVMELRIDSGTVWSLQLDHEGHRLYLGMAGGEVREYDLVKRVWLEPLTAVKSDVASIQVSHDGQRLFVAGHERSGAVAERTPDGWKVLRLVKDTPQYGGQFLPDGRLAVSHGNRVRILSDMRETSAGPPRLYGPWFAVSQSSITEDGNLLAGDGNDLQLINVLTETTGRTLTPIKTTDRIDRLNHRYIVKYEGSSVRIVRPDDTTVLQTEADELLFGIPSLDASPDGRWIAILAKASTLTLVSTQTGQIKTLKVNDGSGYFSFSADSSKLIVADVVSLRSLTVPNLQEEWRLPVEGLVMHVSTSPKGDRLAVSMVDGRIDVLEARSGKVLHSLLGHTEGVYDSSWSPDGSRLVTASEDMTIRIWDPHKGEELGIVGTHPNYAIAVKFLEQGRTIASFSGEGTVKIWRTKASSPPP